MFSSNRAHDGGGAISSDSCNTNITRSAFHGNQNTYGGGFGGGAIIHTAAGNMTITNSTFYNNSGGGEGSAIYLRTTTTSPVNRLSHLTITGNKSGPALQLGHANTVVHLRNSIVHVNPGTSCKRHASRALATNENNIIGAAGDGTGTSCGTGVNGSTEQPLLASSATGDIPYFTLDENSPAVDAAGACRSLTTEDQRGAARPQGFACDIGAYESPHSSLSHSTGVEISSDSMSIIEGGGGTFTVALASDPGANTTVTLVKSRPESFVTVSPATLTFTSGSSGNWGTAQTVTVSAPADLDARDERLMILVLVEVTAKGTGTYHATNNPTANDNAGYRVVGASGSAVAGVYVTVRDNDDGRPSNVAALPGHRLIDYGGSSGPEYQNTGWVIYFQWDAPSGQTVGSYNFQHRKRGGAWQQMPGPTSTTLVNTTNTSVTIRPGYSDNTVVDYRVRARKNGVAGDWATGSVTLANPRNLVTSVRATPAGDGELDVSWRPPASPSFSFTTFDVAYRKSTAPGQDSDDPNNGWVALDPVSGLSTTIGSLEPGVAYRVRVRITSEYDFAWSFGGGTPRACTNCGTLGEPGVVTFASASYADLIEDIYEWRNDARYVSDKRHTDRWDRVLLTFGETVSDTSLTEMTASEAQTYVDRGWSRWVEVAEALGELEAAAQANPPTTQDPPTSSNRAPVTSTVGDVTIVNESGTQSITSTSMFYDPDYDDMTVTGTSSDTSVATVSASADGSILTVSAKSRGAATITATADDGNGGTATNSFTVRVKAAPVADSAISDVTGLTAGTSQLVSLSGVFSDADGDALSVTAAATDENVAVAEMSSDGASLTVTGVSAGDTEVAVFAQDSDGNQVAASFSVSVTASQPVQLVPPEQEQVTSNRAPTVSSPLDDVSGLAEGATTNVALSGVFSDADGDALTITASSDTEAVATASVSADNSTLTVSGVSSGNATITVTAQDPDGERAAVSFDVEVTASNPQSSIDDVVSKYDTNGDGQIDRAEMAVAINDYIAGKITYSQVVEVNKAYQSS